MKPYPLLTLLLLTTQLWANSPNKSTQQPPNKKQKGKIQLLQVIIQDAESEELIGKTYNENTLLELEEEVKAHIVGKVYHPTKKIKTILVNGQTAKIYYAFQPKQMQRTHHQAWFVAKNVQLSPPENNNENSLDELEPPPWQLEIQILWQDQSTPLKKIYQPLDPALEATTKTQQEMDKTIGLPKKNNSTQTQTSNPYSLLHTTYHGLMLFFLFLAALGIYAQLALTLQKPNLTTPKLENPNQKGAT